LKSTARKMKARKEKKGKGNILAARQKKRTAMPLLSSKERGEKKNERDRTHEPLKTK